MRITLSTKDLIRSKMIGFFKNPSSRLKRNQLVITSRSECINNTQLSEFQYNIKGVALGTP